MNVILDLVVVIIAVLSVVIAAKKGFFRTLLSGTAFLLSLVLTIALVSPVKAALKSTSVYENARQSITEWVDETAINAIRNAETNADTALTDATTDNDEFASILKSLGVDVEAIRHEILNGAGDDTEASVKAFAENIGDKVANALVSFMASALLFLVLYVIIKLLAKFLASVIKKFPVLKVADGVLGAVLGAVFGLIRIFAFVSLMHLIVPYMQTSGSEFISAVEPAKTLVFSIFYNINLFAFLF